MLKKVKDTLSSTLGALIPISKKRLKLEKELGNGQNYNTFLLRFQKNPLLEIMNNQDLL